MTKRKERDQERVRESKWYTRRERGNKSKESKNERGEEYGASQREEEKEIRRRRRLMEERERQRRQERGEKQDREGIRKRGNCKLSISKTEEQGMRESMRKLMKTKRKEEQRRKLLEIIREKTRLG